MSDQIELFELNRKHLVGKLITSTVSNGRIAGISYPKEGQYGNILVLTSSDLENNCDCVDIMGEQNPIFAKDTVSYKGQPILAVFGYNYEDVELFCREVKVSYQINPGSENIQTEVFGDPFIWSFGDTGEYFTSNAKVVKSSFQVNSYSNSILGDQRLFAVSKNGQIHLRVASQWPLHVRKSVAQILGMPLDKVKVHPQSYYAPYDQYVIMPTLMAVIVALAAMKSGELAQLCVPMTSFQPRMMIERQTAVLQDGTCVADKVNCTVDLGAFPAFSSEVCHNVLAGLVPVYPLKAMDVNVTILRSSTPPANFFGDLGFSMALAATENHFSHVAQTLGMQPGLWRLDRLYGVSDKGFPLCESVKESTGFQGIRTTADDIIKDSWYSRKYSANSQKNLFTGKVNPLVNYSRGIGISCGESIMGFSQQFNANANYSLSVTMTEDEKVLVNTSLQADRSMLEIWKNTIEKALNVQKEDIFFKDVNDSDIIDIGPSTLSRKIGTVPDLLIMACSDLARKRAFSRLPITAVAKSDADISDPYYFSNCFGTIAIELHIDPIMLSPVIDNIWAYFNMGHVFDMRKLEGKARHTITTMISEICPSIMTNCNIKLKFKQDATLTASSATAAIRGLTASALIGALSQALGHSVHTIPVTSEDIMAISKKPSSKPKEAANEA